MRDLTGQHLGKFLAGNTVGVKNISESLDHIGSQVYSAAHNPVLDGLHGLNNLTKDSESLAPESEFGALKIGHL